MQSFLTRTLAAASLALVFSTATLAKGPPRHPGKTVELQYRLVEIPDFTPDGKQASSAIFSINDWGQVLAVAEDGTYDPIGGDLVRHYFIWHRGIVREIVSNDPAFPYVIALEINNSGEVVGRLLSSTQGGSERAFVWRRGKFKVIGTLPRNGWDTGAGDINDWGEVAGAAKEPDPEFFMTSIFRWYRGRFAEPPLPPTHSSAAADINNFGQIVGITSPIWNFPAGPGTRSFVWNRKGSLRYLDPLPGSLRTLPAAMNDRGQIVGTAEFTDAPSYRAVLWDDGTIMDLGALPGHEASQAHAINLAGTVVGVSLPLAPERASAFVWKDGEMQDLNDLIADDDPLKATVHLDGAADINVFGWIAAHGFRTDDPGLRGRGFLLVPKRRR